MSLLTVDLDLEFTPLDPGLELLECDNCGEWTPAEEGDYRQIGGDEYSLCENCVHDWDTNGIPNHVAARYAG